MDLHIRDQEAQQLAVQLSEQTGESIDFAVKEALRERVARTAPERTLEERWASIQVIQERVAAAIARSGERLQTQAEWDEENYDEWGAPR